MLSRESDGNLYIRSGPEIGVASTKAFTCQMTVLVLLATLSGPNPKNASAEPGSVVALRIDSSAALRAAAPGSECVYEKIAKAIYRHSNALYLGRGIHYPIALEGALKLKEISYIHAEGYPAGEMKHGPNALIDRNLPVVALAAKDPRIPSPCCATRKC